MADACAAFIVILVTFFVPPVGTFFISGCSADLLINICLTLLGYLPGIIHAFYCEYIYFDRRAMGRTGRIMAKPAPGIFSKRIQNGGDIRREYIDSSPPSRFGQQGYDPNTPLQQSEVPPGVGTVPRYY